MRSRGSGVSERAILVFVRPARLYLLTGGCTEELEPAQRRASIGRR